MLFKNNGITFCLKVIFWNRDIFLWGFPDTPFWYAHFVQTVSLFQRFFLQPNQQASSHYYRKIYAMWFLLSESEKYIMIWSSAQRKIYLRIDKKIYLSYFSVNFSCLNILSLYQLFRDFEIFLHVSIWVVPILGDHSFSRSNLPQIWPCKWKQKIIQLINKPNNGVTGAKLIKRKAFEALIKRSWSLWNIFSSSIQEKNTIILSIKLWEENFLKQAFLGFVV